MSDLRPDSDHTRALLAEVEGGDSKALDKLLRHHRPDLRALVEVRLVRRLAARVDPSDVVQETLVVAYRN